MEQMSYKIENIQITRIKLRRFFYNQKGMGKVFQTITWLKKKKKNHIRVKKKRLACQKYIKKSKMTSWEKTEN